MVVSLVAGLLLVVALVELGCWMGVGLTHARETCTVMLKKNNDNEKE